MYKTVDIGKIVDRETLENALKKAAEEIGLKIDIKDNFHEKYKLGSVQETREYKDTTVKLKGRILPVMEIDFGWLGQTSMDYFYIVTGSHGGFASKKKVEKFLDAVSKYL